MQKERLEQSANATHTYAGAQVEEIEFFISMDTDIEVYVLTAHWDSLDRSFTTGHYQ